MTLPGAGSARCARWPTHTAIERPVIRHAFSLSALRYAADDGTVNDDNRWAKALGADLAGRRGDSWASFGYVAAEADLARMGTAPR
jgi:hypothetical protein